LSNYEGEKATPELPTNVYRIDADGSISAAAEGINQPNGLAFSPDESLLYIGEPRTSPRTILAYDVVGGKKLTGRRIAIDAGGLDGVHVLTRKAS
jgi:gluconolactonase